MTVKQVREIAEAKMKDLNANDLEAAVEEDPTLLLQYLRGEELYRDKAVLARLEERVASAGMPSVTGV